MRAPCHTAARRARDNQHSAAGTDGGEHRQKKHARATRGAVCAIAISLLSVCVVPLPLPPAACRSPGQRSASVLFVRAPAVSPKCNEPTSEAAPRTEPSCVERRARGAASRRSIEHCTLHSHSHARAGHAAVRRRPRPEPVVSLSLTSQSVALVAAVELRPIGLHRLRRSSSAASTSTSTSSRLIIIIHIVLPHTGDRRPRAGRHLQQAVPAAALALQGHRRKRRSARAAQQCRRTDRHAPLPSEQGRG